jgi:predicted dehydrogenase
MRQDTASSTSRREFLKQSGRVAAASALAAVAVPRVHAAENNTIQVALIGCGGRGTGAAADAMSVKYGPVKLVALADVFADRVKGSYDNLKKQFAAQVDVPQDRQFVGFDGYRKAMDCLKPGDVAIFATPLAFRWVDFTYAIQKGLNVFMEKPLTADGPTSRRMLKLAEEAQAKNLKVGVGLMSRHSRAMQELAQRIRGGEVGDLLAMRAYREHGPVGSFFSTAKPAGENELLWQIRRFHSFIWASGGAFSDANIHLIDSCCWMKGAWPVLATAIGGREFRNDFVDQNFDNYGVEYTFADDTKLTFFARFISGCHDQYASYGQGAKGLAVISKSGDCGQPSSIYRGKSVKKAKMLWESKAPEGEGNPYQNEWNDLVDAIRNDKPYNEVKRGVEASVVTSMGRMAAHTGRAISFDDMLNCEHEMAPGADKFTTDSAAPVVANAQGKYPVPLPGIVTKREY